MRNKWGVAYQIATEESVETGDYAEMGWIAERCDSLRDAIEEARDFDHSGLVESSCYPLPEPGTLTEGYAPWFTFYPAESNNWGPWESRNLFPPSNITASSFRRVAKCLQCYGVK